MEVFFEDIIRGFIFLFLFGFISLYGVFLSFFECFFFKIDGFCNKVLCFILFVGIDLVFILVGLFLDDI